LLGAVFISAHLTSSPSSSLNCDLGGYRAQNGLTAAMTDNQLVVTWNGARDAEVRARYGIDNGQPLVRDVAVRKAGATWATLAENLKPEYRVVIGVRRMSTQQADPLRAAGVELTPDVIEKNRWYAFWDAPLFIPEPPAAGRGQPAARTLGPPRTAAEIRRATATFNSSSCSVRTDGSRSQDILGLSWACSPAT
jgi:hypothetical protein